MMSAYNLHDEPAYDQNAGSQAIGQPSALDVLARMTRVLADEWDADVVLHRFVQEASDLFGSAMVLLWLTDASSHHLTLAYSFGAPPAQHSDDEATAAIAAYDLDPDRDGKAVLTRALRSLEPFEINLDGSDEQESTADSAPLLAYARAHHFAALLMIPLLARGRLLGVLGLGSPDEGAFGASDSQLTARLLGDLFALTIESTGLQQRLRETNARLVTASIEAQQRAEEIADEKEEREAFISLVAHELRNPLTILKTHIALLQRPGRDPQKQAAALATMANKARQLQRLIEDLLDVSRIATGHFAIEPAPADLVAIAREITQESQATTQRHRLQMLTERDELECVCDRQRVTQALSNLVSNAIKYSPDGGDIVVRVASDDTWARLSVEDHGTGLTEDDLAHLFQPYARILRVREARGIGLGLFIAKGIAEAHGGAIAADSPGVGQGATFSIWIPRLGPQAERGSEESEAPLPAD